MAKLRSSIERRRRKQERAGLGPIWLDWFRSRRPVEVLVFVLVFVLTVVPSVFLLIGAFWCGSGSPEWYCPNF